MSHELHHADTSLVPSSITTKAEFWAHVHTQLSYLLDGQRNWVTNLANASSLVYNSLSSFPSHFGSGDRAVNWCGFYLESSLFPGPGSSTQTPFATLLLAPFNGKPACQFIRAKEGKGVCANAFVRQETILVTDVNSYPGHIACDGDTNSEIVIPMILKQTSASQESPSEVARTLGVMDLDCLALGGFDEEDRKGLEAIVALVVQSCDW